MVTADQHPLPCPQHPLPCPPPSLLAVLVGMSGQLNSQGVVQYFAGVVSAVQAPEGGRLKAP